MWGTMQDHMYEKEKRKKKPKVRWFYGSFYFETASTQTSWDTVKPNISNAKPDDGETLLNLRTQVHTCTILRMHNPSNYSETYCAPLKDLKERTRSSPPYVVEVPTLWQGPSQMFI